MYQAAPGRQVTLWTSFGSAIEYYDFVIYGMMATYLSQIFFHTPASGIPTFLVFAVGYIARPVGGTIAGMVGDTWGRKPAFLLATSLMGISTFAIGCLPTSQVDSRFGVGLLIVCRLLQGVSFGGELPGAVTFVGEMATPQQRGWRCSIVLSATSVGALMASLMLSALSSVLTEAEILSWGWRIPFLWGGMCGGILLIARYRLIETPAFLAHAQHTRLLRTPLMSTLRNHRRALLQGCGLTVFFAAMVVANLFYPYYLSTFFHYELKTIYVCITLSLIFSATIIPIAGKLSDTIAKEKLLRWTCLGYGLFSMPLILGLWSQSFFALCLFLGGHQLFLALFGAVYFPLMINLFPVHVRYTGIGLCYNFIYALASFLPASFTFLLGISQNVFIVPIGLSGLALIPLLALNLTHISNAGHEKHQNTV